VPPPRRAALTDGTTGGPMIGPERNGSRPPAGRRRSRCATAPSSAFRTRGAQTACSAPTVASSHELLDLCIERRRLNRLDPPYSPGRRHASADEARSIRPGRTRPPNRHDGSSAPPCATTARRVWATISSKSTVAHTFGLTKRLPGVALDRRTDRRHRAGANTGSARPQTSGTVLGHDQTCRAIATGPPHALQRWISHLLPV